MADDEAERSIDELRTYFEQLPLHPEIRIAVQEAFDDDIDLVAAKAYLKVITAVRKAADISGELSGSELMRLAFDPEKGALSDMDDELSDREAIADLFAGAMGSYTIVTENDEIFICGGLWSAEEAGEMLVLASYLMRLVERHIEKRQLRLQTTS